MENEKRLLNKKVVVTGGSRGIGAGIVERLYSEGAEIIIVDVREELAKNLIDKVEELKLELASVESSTIPFLQEFGNQDNYIKVFGRTGLRIKDNKIVESKTVADFEGEITLGPPQIEKLDKYEFRAIYPDNEFLNLRIKGGQSEVIKLTPPRNQISIGPMLGVLYNTDTGLTTPTIGVGVTYNMIKLWDWK